MNQSELLTSERLKLSETVRMGINRSDRSLIRGASGAERLVLTPAQAAVLIEGFSRPSTAPEVLVSLLQGNTCPPLDEFYELVLQAHSAGVLSLESRPDPVPKATKWPYRLPFGAAGIVAQVILAASVIALLVPKWGAPAGWPDWLLGWLEACLLLSAGEVLAACALSDGACEVRGLRLCWLTLFPHFSVDSGEAAMGGRKREYAVAALRAMPVAAAAAVVAWQLPGLLAPMLAAVFYVLAPWGGSAASQWIDARFGSPRLTVQGGFLFEQRRDDAWEQFREWRRSLTGRSALHWLSWILLVGLACVRLFPGVASRLPASFGPAGQLHPLADAALYTLAAAIVAAGACLSKAFLRHWWRGRKMARPLRSDSTRRPAGAPLEGDPVSVLRQVALFNEMADEDLAALAQAMQTVKVGKNRDVFCEDDAADAFYVILEGEVAVLKRRPKPSKRVEEVGWLGPGVGFGEIALLEGTSRTATVRATRDCTLLKLGKADFDQMVVGRVGAARVRELLQYAAFLGRLVFLSGWPFEELLRYAHRCGTVRFESGATVLTRGEQNNWFFLIYDGAFEARDGKRVLRRMQPGDYFGEISLLENGQATADVVAVEESRCLTMVRSDFLRFFATDYRIGLRMESLAGRRLGSSLFVSR
jgi:CRP-like cAMP-binding protein